MIALAHASQLRLSHPGAEGQRQGHPPRDRDPRQPAAERQGPDGPGQQGGCRRQHPCGSGRCGRLQWRHLRECLRGGPDPQGQELRRGRVPHQRLPGQHAHLPGAGQERRCGGYCHRRRHLPRVLLRPLLRRRRYPRQRRVLPPPHHPQLPPTGKVPSPARARSRRWRSWMPAPSRPLPPTAVC